jgi:hypothetical protein
MLDTCPDTLIGRRDRALLAFGFAGAFRRAELVALEIDDLVEVADGLRVVIRHSKTDQEGQGQRSPFRVATASAPWRPCTRGWRRRRSAPGRLFRR